jgi:hypothetical protein
LGNNTSALVAVKHKKHVANKWSRVGRENLDSGKLIPRDLLRRAVRPLTTHELVIE